MPPSIVKIPCPTVVSEAFAEVGVYRVRLLDGDEPDGAVCKLECHVVDAVSLLDLIWTVPTPRIGPAAVTPDH